MKHTLKDKYAADGLTAHRQRMTAQPGVTQRMRDQARLDQITARLTAKPEDFELAALRKQAMDGIKAWFTNSFEKQLFAQLAAYKPLEVRRPAQFQLSGRSADTIIMDDLRHDDVMDAAVFSMKHLSAMAPASPNWTLGVDIARPGRDFGVIKMDSASC